jgi:hypothetical protein
MPGIGVHYAGCGMTFRLADVFRPSRWFATKRPAPVFEIDRNERGDRLKANAVLKPADFESIARKIGRPPLRARKIGYVAARKAARSEVVETRWSGKETTSTARAGDFVVTNLSPQRQPLRDDEGHMNVYVIVADRFPNLYEPAAETSDLGAIYRAKGVVSALQFTGGFDIAAPWGSRQAASDGYLLCNGEEVYGSSKEAFEATYEAVRA